MQLGYGATETRRRTASGFVVAPFCHIATAVGGSCGIALGFACADGLANGLGQRSFALMWAVLVEGSNTHLTHGFEV